MDQVTPTVPNAAAVQQALGMTQRSFDVTADMQKQVLAVCEHAGKGWAERLQSEIQLCSDAWAQLAGVRSGQDLLNVYSDCLSRRMRLAAEDAQRLCQDYLHVTEALTKAVTSTQAH